MKKALMLAVVLFAAALNYAQTGVPGQITTSFVQVRDHGSSGGPVTRPCMLWLPEAYADSETPDYPLIIFFHGHGERGNPNGANVNALKTYGPFHFLDNDTWDGTTPGFGGDCGNPNFIVFAFQTDEDFSNAEIDYAITQLRLRYRIDLNRMIFTGPSGGGGTTYSYAMDLARTNKPKHIIPMSVPTADFTNVSTVAGNGMKVWAFADDSANVGAFYTTTTSIVSAFNNAVSNSARFTGRSLGHCCWNDYYDPSYKETDGSDTVNIYEWAMKRMPAPAPSWPSGLCLNIPYVFGKFAGYISLGQTNKIGACNATCWKAIYTDDGAIASGKRIYDSLAYPLDGLGLHYGYNTLQLKGGPGDKHMVIDSSGYVTTFDNCISPAGYVSTATYGDASAACLKSCSTLVYSNAGVISTGIKLYNSDGTTAFAGNWADYGFTTTQYGTAQRRLNIDGSGFILSDASCSGGGSRLPGGGVSEADLNRSVRIFPNPASQQLNIQTGNITEPVKLQLYNMIGILAYESTITHQHTIQLAKFPRGVYMLKLKTQSGKLLEAQKIIIR